MIINKKSNRSPVEAYNTLSSYKDNFIKGSDLIYIN
jgi:hypothetical protein